MSLESEMKQEIEGEVLFDKTSRLVYSVDASIFEIEPLGVILPKHRQDLQRAVEIAFHYRVPVTVRGAATGITGGCLGHGIILDLSKYLHKILKIDTEQKFALCEPGVVQDDLNRVLHQSGYRLGPDTSTGNRATIGGMLANNAAGARSLKFGTMKHHVEEVELMLANGEKINCSLITEEEWSLKRSLKNQEGEIYRILWNIKQEDRDEILERFPSIPRRVSGYNLDLLVNPGPFNLSKLIAGSEGTLGIATQIKMGIVPLPKALALLLIFFDSLTAAFQSVEELLTTHPLSLELIDHQIISLGRSSPSLKHQLRWIQGDPQAILVVELEGENHSEVENKIKTLQEELKKKKIGRTSTPLFQPQEINLVWDLRKAGLGILLSKRTYSRAIAFLEDLSIPPPQLAPFMEQFSSYLKKIGKEAGIYGHVGSGCMHIRPYVDLRKEEERDLMIRMMDEVSTLVLKFGGALSGEHGDGYIRSWLNPKMFGNKIADDFRKIKKAFDPHNLMNPDKIVSDHVYWNELRTVPDEKLQIPKTFLDFSPEGGFALAADLCNGNGLCRKQEGVMCPSFQATREEFHSTRARAQTLRSIIHKKVSLDAFTGQGLYDVMDLCLSCKGCKTECPSQVDMAKFKSEFLYHYQEKHGYSLRTRLFAHIGKINAWMSPLSSLFNSLLQTAFSKIMMEWIGISPRRSFPPLAKERFSVWYNQMTQPRKDKAVLLLNDTFTEFNHPETGQAAVHLLNACGYHVDLPPWSCCGRPALSKGLLPTARKQARHLIDLLYSYAQNDIPIIGLEPSCLLTLRDDYPSLIENHDKLGRILPLILTLDEFLAPLSEQETFRKLFRDEKQKVKVHGHCYQKALIGMEPTLKVLQAIPGFEVELIDSGCCGMAGSFGYEKEHEPISMKIGELHLFPSVRSSHPSDLIIANGISCRHQILDGTGRTPLHLAQALCNKLVR